MKPLDLLHRYGVSAFRLAREVENSAEARSTFVAYTVGKQARRLAISEEDLSSWFQRSYSSLWVRESNLNPGLDAKDVRKFVLQGYHNNTFRESR